MRSRPRASLNRFTFLHGLSARVVRPQSLQRSMTALSRPISRLVLVCPVPRRPGAGSVLSFLYRSTSMGLNAERRRSPRWARSGFIRARYNWRVPGRSVEKASCSNRLRPADTVQSVTVGFAGGGAPVNKMLVFNATASRCAICFTTSAERPRPRRLRMR